MALSTDRLASALVTESLAVAIHCLVAAVLIGAQSGWRGRSGYLRRSAVTAAGCAGMVAESIWLRLGDVLIAEEGGRERSRRPSPPRALLVLLCGGEGAAVAWRTGGVGRSAAEGVIYGARAPGS